jgi:hypothetical protein
MKVGIHAESIYVVDRPIVEEGVYDTDLTAQVINALKKRLG